MEIVIDNDDIIIKKLENFDPEHIFECGQAFRWDREEDGSYTVVAFNRVLNVLKVGEDVIFRNTNLEDFENIWKNYFDLNTEYKAIQETFNSDETMKKCIEYGDGIRILQQDEFETIISFMISANNRIPQIKKSIRLICEKYGNFIETYNNRDYYSFPTPSELSICKPEDLREHCRVGFRDERIYKVANMIENGEFPFYDLKNKTREEIRDTLITLPGIGEKIADCITLFGYDKKDSFPVDVWIKRVMETLYFGKEVKKKEVSDLGRDKFGKYAGVAQQYLFYYGRENKIGK